MSDVRNFLGGRISSPAPDPSDHGLSAVRQRAADYAERIRQLEEALRPFADLAASALQGGVESYAVLPAPPGLHDITRRDILQAGQALNR